MKLPKLIQAFVAVLVLSLGSITAQAASCGNNNQGGQDRDDPPESDASDPFQVYTGNDHRSVNDLTVWGGVGQHQLNFTRYANSRIVWTNKPTFGDGHSWRHTYLWELTTASNDSMGRRRMQLIYPNGTLNMFTEISSSQWLSTANVTDIISPDGANFVMQTKEGYLYHFIKVGTTFQMQYFTDAYGSTYNLTYNSAGAVTKVTEPGGRYITIAYTNIVEQAPATTPLATISTPPAAGWNTVNVTNTWGYAYLTFVSADSARGELSEVQFYATGSTTPLTGTPFGTSGTSTSTDFTKATDNDTSTYFEATDVSGGFAGIKVPGWVAPTSLTIKYYVRPGYESTFIGAKFQASESYAKTISVIGQVQSSDGRSVTYHYSPLSDPNLPTVYQTLTSVTYGDGTNATYVYAQPIPGTQPVMTESNDPRYDKRYPFVRVSTRYQTTDTTVVGFIDRQVDASSGATIAALNTSVSWDLVAEYPTAGSSSSRKMHYNINHSNGHVNTHTDGNGKSDAYTFDQSGNGYEIEYKDKKYNSWKRTNSAYNSPVTRTYPNLATESWTRDSLDLPLTHTDELGRVTTYTRDSQHRITRTDYPDLTYETFTYNSFNQPTSHRFRNGGTETSIYDSRGLVTSYTDVMGGVTSVTYDANDRVASVTDANSHTTSYVYDERGLVTKMTYADGTYITSTYDDYGNLTSATTVLGQTNTFSYDNYRRMISRVDALGRVTTDAYSSPFDPQPQLSTVPSGKQIYRTFDALYRLSTVTIGYGTVDAATTTYTYDNVGNIIKVTDPAGHDWLRGYDTLNRKVSDTNPLGQKTSYTYDAAGNMTKITRPDGGTIVKLYDSMNRLARLTNPKGEVTKYSYDNADNLLTVTDHRNKVYTYTYDLLKRCTSLTYPDGSAESYTYDPVGNVLTFTTRGGQIKTIAYDSRNRAINESWSDGTPAAIRTYDGVGRLISSDNGISASDYAYDSANELVSDTQTNATSGAARVVSYTYDADGNKSSLVYPSGITVSYGYTGRNLLKSISAGANVAMYTYDGNSNLLTKALANGSSASYSFDSGNKLTVLDNIVSGGSFARFDYGYDNVNRRIYEKRNGGAGDAYSYDAIDQIVGVNYEATNPSAGSFGATRVVGYNYDASGNRTSTTDTVNGNKTYAVNDANQYSTINTASLGYDSNGNLSNGMGTFTYDAQNRLIVAQLGSNIDHFYYDSRNRVVQRDANGVSVFFVYDDWNILEERDGAGALTASYIHGVYIDEILSKTSSANTVYYHQNGIGSITALTDGAGTVVEKYKYDAFGKATIFSGAGLPLSASAYDNRFFFTGREYLSEIGVYDFRNRIYSSDLGRFLQTDPLSLTADVNIYRYCANNPISKIDPLGLLITDMGQLVVSPDPNGPTHEMGMDGQSFTAYTNQGNPIHVFKPDDKGKGKGDNAKYNCIADANKAGKYWIPNSSDAQKILDDDGWKPTNNPKDGDIGVLRDQHTGDVVHEESVTDSNPSNPQNPIVDSKAGSTPPEVNRTAQTIQNEFDGATKQSTTQSFYTGGGNIDIMVH